VRGIGEELEQVVVRGGKVKLVMRFLLVMAAVVDEQENSF
jgi:hypothetical protein